MDFGTILKAPFEDSDWLKKLLLMGAVNVLLCITVIGIFVGLPNLIGWGVTYGRNRIAGNRTLPEFGFGYIGLGYRSIVSMLSLFVVYLVVGIVISILARIFGAISSSLAFIPLLLYIPVLIAMIPFGIAVQYRFVVHDDMMAGIRFGWLLGFVKSHLGTLFFAFLIAFVVMLLTSAMGIVPIIGGMFGAAFGMAANNALIAELARVTNRE